MPLFGSTYKKKKTYEITNHSLYAADSNKIYT